MVLQRRSTSTAISDPTMRTTATVAAMTMAISLLCIPISFATEPLGLMSRPGADEVVAAVGLLVVLDVVLSSVPCDMVTELVDTGFGLVASAKHTRCPFDLVGQETQVDRQVDRQASRWLNHYLSNPIKFVVNLQYGVTQS